MNQDLHDKVQSVVTTIETGEGLTAMLEQHLGIDFIVTDRLLSKGAKILVTYGGPNIWINTQYDTVQGFWWGDEVEIPYYRNRDLLDEWVNERFEIAKGQV